MTEPHGRPGAASRDDAVELVRHGRLGEARELLQALCAGEAAGDADAWYWLARVSGRMGSFDDAARCARRAVALVPGHAPAHIVLAKALQQSGSLPQALEAFSAAVAADPGNAEAQGGLAHALFLAGRLEQAVACCEAAVRLAPQSPDAHYNLGLVLTHQQRFRDAVPHFLEAVTLNPRFAAAYNSLGAACYKLQDHDAAVAHYQRALELDPDCAEAYSNLGSALRDAGRTAEAEGMYQEALRRNPRLIEAYQGLATNAHRRGDAAGAAAVLRRALAVAPQRKDVHSDLLMTMCYLPETTPQSMLQTARAWEDPAAAAPVPAPPAAAGAAADDGRRLRIGYVSGDLHEHPVGFFLGCVLDHHDHDRYEIHCYNNDTLVDAQTERLRAASDHWRDVAGLSDDALLAAIRADRIDVLLDLSGHTGRNRLHVFARRAAPVQATWMGYFATTGISAMDFLIGDPVVTPEGCEAGYSERVVRLPHSYLCFNPPRAAVDTVPAPLRRNGCVTFGSFNNQGKVTPDVVACWAAVLRAVPGSRLLLKYRGLDDADVVARYHRLFEDQGVAPGRVELEGKSPRDGLLRAYRRLDIALDPFPYNGGITSMEALWMGVPVVALAGTTFVGRVGASILTSAGLDRLIARDVDEYVAICRDLASQPDRLAGIRNGLRARVLASPLCDARAYAAAAEALYRDMWSQRGGAG